MRAQVLVVGTAPDLAEEAAESVVRAEGVPAHAEQATAAEAHVVDAPDHAEEVGIFRLVFETML